MKTKLLSTLILFACTAVMFVGCRGEKKLIQQDCNSCTSEAHIIEENVAFTLIADFHNTFIYSQKISNAGCIIDLNSWKDGFVISGFKPLKMHYGFDITSKRLTAMIETKTDKCNNNVYQGKLGIESEELLTTNSVINPLIEASRQITVDQVRDYFNNTANQFNSNSFEISNSRAIAYHGNFINHFNEHYPCDDMFFYPKTSINEISEITENSNFAYFYGYDNDPAVEHKIRVIFVGLDSNGRLKYTNSGQSLMRDYSRPHPIAGPSKSKP